MSDTMDFVKLLKSGIAAGAIILVLSQVVQMATAAVWPYNILTLGGMRAASDPIMLLFFLHPFVLGLAFAYAYQRVESAIKLKGINKGISFSLLMWIVAGLPAAFLVWSSMDYPIGFTVNSVIGSLIYMLATGIAIQKLSE